jgi:hypothetical protein
MHDALSHELHVDSLMLKIAHFVFNHIQMEVCLIRKPKVVGTIPHYSEPIPQMPFFDVCFEL